MTARSIPDSRLRALTGPAVRPREASPPAPAPTPRPTAQRATAPNVAPLPAHLRECPDCGAARRSRGDATAGWR